MTFTDLCHERSHLESQLFVHREVALLNFIIHLVRQQEALSLRLSFHLRSETQPVHAQMKKKVVMKLVFLGEAGITYTSLHFQDEVNLNAFLRTRIT